MCSSCAALGSSPAPQLAWVGLGNMGRGMARNLATRAELHNKPLLLFNRSPNRCEDLKASLPEEHQNKVSSPPPTPVLITIYPYLTSQADGSGA